MSLFRNKELLNTINLAEDKILDKLLSIKLNLIDRDYLDAHFKKIEEAINALAKKPNAKRGPKKLSPRDKAIKMLERGISVAKVAKVTGIKASTLYNIKANLKKGSSSTPPEPTSVYVKLEDPNGTTDTKAS